MRGASAPAVPPLAPVLALALALSGCIATAPGAEPLRRHDDAEPPALAQGQLGVTLTSLRVPVLGVAVDAAECGVIALRQGLVVAGGRIEARWTPGPLSASDLFLVLSTADGLELSAAGPAGPGLVLDVPTFALGTDATLVVRFGLPPDGAPIVLDQPVELDLAIEHYGSPAPAFSTVACPPG